MDPPGGFNERTDNGNGQSVNSLLQHIHVAANCAKRELGLAALHHPGDLQGEKGDRSTMLGNWQGMHLCRRPSLTLRYMVEIWASALFSVMIISFTSSWYFIINGMEIFHSFWRKECWTLLINICLWSFLIITGVSASTQPFTILVWVLFLNLIWSLPPYLFLRGECYFTFGGGPKFFHEVRGGDQNFSP